MNFFGGGAVGNFDEVNLNDNDVKGSFSFQGVRSVDGIPAKFIKLVFLYVLNFILDLANCALLTTSKYPCEWKSGSYTKI